MKTKGIDGLKQEIIALNKRIDELKQKVKDKEEFTPEEYLNIVAARHEFIEEIYDLIEWLQSEIEIQEGLDAESAERYPLEETNIEPATRELLKESYNIIESVSRESIEDTRNLIETLQLEIEIQQELARNEKKRIKK